MSLEVPTDGAVWRIAVVASNKRLAEDAREALGCFQYMETITVASVTITSIQWPEVIDGRSVMVRLTGGPINTPPRQNVGAVFSPVEVVFAVTELDWDGVPLRDFRRWLKSLSADSKRLALCFMMDPNELARQGNDVMSWLWRHDRKHGAAPCRLFRTRFHGDGDGSEFHDMKSLADYYDELTQEF
jgi:hypothetical protein